MPITVEAGVVLAAALLRRAAVQALSLHDELLFGIYLDVFAIESQPLDTLPRAVRPEAPLEDRGDQVEEHTTVVCCDDERWVHRVVGRVRLVPMHQRVHTLRLDRSHQLVRWFRQHTTFP